MAVLVRYSNLWLYNNNDNNNNNNSGLSTSTKPGESKSSQKLYTRQHISHAA